MDDVVSSLVALRGHDSIAMMSDETSAALKRCILDSLGCALGAVGQRVPQKIATMTGVPTLGGTSTIVGRAATVTAEQAAFVNGVLIRYLDFNDTYASSDGLGHPSDYISAVLAVGEECRSPGDRVMQGIAAVYEVFCRLTDSLPLGFKNIDHVVYGAVASAYGAGVLWGLSDEALGNAVSLALVANISLLATRFGSLSTWKGCAAGNAARNGVFAARLALHGVDGPAAPFQGRGGLCELIGRDFDQLEFNRDDRGAAALRSNLKSYPCGVLAQSAIEAAATLHPRLSSHDITGVTVRTFNQAVKMMASDPEKWTPTSSSTADHSLPYVVARTLAYGDLDGASFEPLALSDQKVRRIMSVLRVEEDAELTAMWPQKMPARLEVTLSSGEQFEERVDAFRGSSSNPMAFRDVERKLRAQAEPEIGANGVNQVIDTCARLEEESAGALLKACVAKSGFLKI